MRNFFNFLFLIPVLLNAQLSQEELDFFRKKEDSLRILERKMFFSKDDTAKFRANLKFLDQMEVLLNNTASFNFPFDSLKEIGKLTSPDKKFRLIHWNIPKKDGTHHYSGFIQVLNSKTNKYDVFELSDKSTTIKSPETHAGDYSKWFGMLYYSVIPCDDYYILLGWDGNDKTIARKFIDVLYFKNDLIPWFGKDVFKMRKKNPKRVMFEYSAELVMSLKYHSDKRMIIFDHLAPKDPMLTGQFQFYGPDFSYDGFQYRHGKWVFEEDVDVKNPRNKNDNVQKKKTKEKPIYQPK